MIRSKQVKINAILTIRVIKLLFYNEMTADDEERIERELIEAYEEQDECEPY